MVHAWVLARSDRRTLDDSISPRPCRATSSDIQQGTTAEGVHLGAMAGTVDLVQRVSTGIEITGDVLRFSPRLPDALARLDMRIRYRGHTLDLKLKSDALTVRARVSDAEPIRLQVKDEIQVLQSGSTRVFSLETHGASAHTSGVSAQHEKA